jgi:hypothetical protein
MLLVKPIILEEDIKYTKHARNRSVFKQLIRVLVRQIVCWRDKNCETLNIPNVYTMNRKGMSEI